MVKTGKGWYIPKIIDQGKTLRAGTRKPGKGVRSLKVMDLVGLSSMRDVAQLNGYLWDIRNAIINWQVDGDHILPDSISSSQIARKSIAASCLADDLVFDQNLTITGYLSTGSEVYAGSGVYTEGDVSAAGNVSGDDIVAVGNLTATDVIAEKVIASVVVSAYSTADLSVDNNARITGDLTADAVSANNGFETAASGEFHSGINTAFLSSINDVIGNGGSLSSTWTTVNSNSAGWSSAGAPGIVVEAGSAYWDSTHQSVSANSAYWMGISSLSGDLQVTSLSTDGDITAASGEFHEGINTSYLSCTGNISAASGEFGHGYTGSFTVNGGVNTAYISSGIIVAVV